MLDPMETIPMPRNSRRKCEIPTVTHAIFELWFFARAKPTHPIGPKTRAKRCAGRKRALGATPKTRFGEARATRVYENAFCRTLFILLENNPETPYRPKDYTSESYSKRKVPSSRLVGGGGRGL